MSEKKQRLSLDEISLKKWVGLVVVDIALGYLVAAVFGVVLQVMNIGGEWAWLTDTLTTYIAFASLFLFFMLFLRTICKTTLRDFLVGEGKMIDWRQTVVIGALYAAGFLIGAFLFSDFGRNLTLNDADVTVILVNLILALAFTWVQTTWEELVFRGVALRWACGNKIRVCSRSLIAAFVISAVFMLGHIANPEVTSQANVADIAASCFYYFFVGFLMYMADLVFGDLMPGCAIHWVNNFMSFAVINQVGTALQAQSFVIDHTPVVGTTSLVGAVVTYLPVIVYTAYHWKKRSASVAEA